MQLLDVRKQLELELKQFTTMFGQLKLAQSRFQSCVESVDAIRPENQSTSAAPAVWQCWRTWIIQIRHHLFHWRHRSTCLESCQILRRSSSILVRDTMWKRYAARFKCYFLVGIYANRIFFIQSRPAARKLYQEKIAYVVKNMEQLKDTIHKKQDNMRVVTELLQMVRWDGLQQSDQCDRKWSSAKMQRRFRHSMKVWYYGVTRSNCKQINQKIAIT